MSCERIGTDCDIQLACSSGNYTFSNWLMGGLNVWHRRTLKARSLSQLVSSRFSRLSLVSRGFNPSEQLNAVGKFPVEIFSKKSFKKLKGLNVNFCWKGVVSGKSNNTRLSLSQNGNSSHTRASYMDQLKLAEL